MPTATETGYHRDLANAHKIITISSSLGTAYTPGNTAISLQAMNSRYNTAKSLMDNLQVAEGVWKQAVRERKRAFSDMQRSLTSLGRHLKSYRLTTAELEAAAHCIAKLRGERVGAAAAGEEGAPAQEGSTNNSVSQRSFDNQLKHYRALIAQLRSMPAYTPVESGFLLSDLDAVAASLEALNQQVFTGVNSLATLRDQRNHELYTDEQSLIRLTGAARSYLISKLDSGTSSYKQLMGIRFRSNP